MKKQKLLEKKSEVTALLVAFLYWLLTFYTDTKLFTKEPLDFGSLPMDLEMAPWMHSLTKVLLLIFLCVLFLFIQQSLKRKTRLIPFFAFLAIYVAGLLLTYPGYYMNDDAILFAFATRYYPVYWHNYLTSLFYMVGMSFFPASCGPVLLSEVMYAMVYAFLFDKAYHLFERKQQNKKWSFLLLLAGVLPFTLLGALMCFRPAVYSSFFVFYFGYLCLEWMEQAELSKAKLVSLALLTAVLAFWRSESLVLLPIGCILIGCTYFQTRFFTKKCIKQMAVYLLLSVVFMGIIKVPQSIGEQKYYGSDYLIISTTRPLSVIVHREQHYDGAFEDYQNINAVTSLDYLKNDTLSCSAYNRYNADQNDGKFTQTMATKAQQSAYLKSAARLILHNLDLYLGERLQLFLVTNGIFTYDPKIVDGLSMTFQGGYEVYEHDKAYSFGMLEQFKRINITSDDTYVMGLFRYGGEAYLPMLGLTMVLLMYSLIRRKWFLFFAFGAFLAREAVVFLLAPTSFIQYSYPMMYGTAFLFLLLLAEVLAKKKNEMKS